MTYIEHQVKFFLLTTQILIKYVMLFLQENSEQVQHYIRAVPYVHMYMHAHIIMHMVTL